jgi:hypothetical protein
MTRGAGQRSAQPGITGPGMSGRGITRPAQEGPAQDGPALDGPALDGPAQYEAGITGRGRVIRPQGGRGSERAH